jgi:hypothetical protein
MRKGLWFLVGVAAVCYFLLRPHGNQSFTPDGRATLSSTSGSADGTVVPTPPPSAATPNIDPAVSASSTVDKPSAAEPAASSTATPGGPYIPDTGDPLDPMGTPDPRSSGAANPSDSQNRAVGSGASSGMNGTGAPMTILSRGVSLRADRDGAKNGCHGGELRLQGPSLSFTCPAPHEDKGVTLTVDQVKGVDKNGIELVSKKKYHFHLEDMSEDQVVRLFSNWIQAARTSPGMGS